MLFWGCLELDRCAKLAGSNYIEQSHREAVYLCGTLAGTRYWWANVGLSFSVYLDIRPFHSQVVYPMVVAPAPKPSPH